MMAGRSASLARNNLVCSCFFTDNYFIKSFCQHVTFVDRKDFINKHAEDLLSGCSAEESNFIVKALEAEQERRRSLAGESLRRGLIIRHNYVPLHGHLYQLKDEFLSAEFLTLRNQCTTAKESNRTAEAALAAVLPLLEKVRGLERVYRVPVFTRQFCREFIDELKHFEKSDMPKGRPNTMNRYGILLEEMGFDTGLITPLRELYLQPIFHILYPEYIGQDGRLDSHRAFVVHYNASDLDMETDTLAEDHDIDLDPHYDNAEVTLNVSLDNNFVDGALYFGRMNDEQHASASNAPSFVPCTHIVTTGILHRGGHIHGAMPIAPGGERYNLIIWLRSSMTRNKRCPMCRKRPTLVEIEEGKEGDGFSSDTVQVCAVT